MTVCDPRNAPRITSRLQIGATGIVVQQQELTFKRLFIENPLLIFVERGIKSVHWSGGEYIIRSGEAIALAGGQPFDITNRLEEDGSYQARWLVWDDTLITEYANAHPELAVIHHAQPMIAAPEAFVTALHRAVQSLEDEHVPVAIASHHLREILLWVGLQGCRFEHTSTLTMAVKVRRLIGQDLAHDWSAAKVASAFAMSEATLRRRLADEGTNLSHILTDVRMSFALQMLQSTTQPVVQIALSVGYQTPSQFAVRFRDRFGFPPTAIRGHRRTHIQ